MKGQWQKFIFQNRVQNTRSKIQAEVGKHDEKTLGRRQNKEHDKLAKKEGRQSKMKGDKNKGRKCKARETQEEKILKIKQEITRNSEGNKHRKLTRN